MSKVTIEMKEKEVKKPTSHYPLHTSQKGITLIALVITIIVMLILVSVTISMAINGGLFEYAGKATVDTKNAINAEQQLANGHIVVDGKEYASIDDYLEGKEILPTYDNADKNENGILKENATYTDANSETAVVPKGFQVIEGLNGSKTIAEGLVIQDASGNEFVWIPVTFTVAEGSQKDENGLYPEFLAVFYRSNWSGNARGTTKYTADSRYTEPYASGYTTPTTESADYYEMMRSVQENSGFYIGRYEAGSQDESGNPVARTDKANGTSKVVVKRDQYPYIYIGWGAGMSNYTENVTYSSKNQGQGALYLCKHMYDGKNIGATSTLCYGIQWDAMLDFIKDDTHNVTNSTSWGNYYDNAWTITRTTAKWTTSVSSDTTWIAVTAEGKSNTSRQSILLTTGASDSFCAKNIYDVAGNVCEWTNEAASSTSRVFRGGYYYSKGSVHTASIRSYDYSPSNCYDFIGFRPALYIK